MTEIQKRGAARVALIVDHPQRDLLGVFLVARELAARGHVVYMVPMNLRQAELSALATDLVMLNYLKRPNEHLARRLLDAGMAVGVLDTEGGAGIIGTYGDVEDHYGNVMAQSQVTRERVAMVCTWGSAVGSHVVKRGWYRPDQVLVTGCPRYDVYAEPWRNLALDVSEANEIATPMVLIIGSYPFANPRLRTIEEEIVAKMANGNYPREVVEQQQRRDVDALEDLVALVLHLAGVFPHVSFVVRPHPFEGEALYEQRFSQRANVRVIRSGTVDAWIMRSAAIIQANDGTTAIDAAMAGVPALIPAWSVPELAVPAIVELGYPMSDPEHVVDTLSRVLDHREVDPSGARRGHIAQLIDEWCHASDGKAHVRVADAIEDRVETGRVNVRALRRLHYRADETGRPTLARLMDTVKMRVRFPYHWSMRKLGVVPHLRWDDSAKVFTPEQVARLLAAADDAGGLSGVTVRPATPGSDYAFSYAGRSVVLERSN